VASWNYWFDALFVRPFDLHLSVVWASLIAWPPLGHAETHVATSVNMFGSTGKQDHEPSWIFSSHNPAEIMGWLKLDAGQTKQHVIQRTLTPDFKSSFYKTIEILHTEILIDSLSIGNSGLQHQYPSKKDFYRYHHQSKNQSSQSFQATKLRSGPNEETLHLMKTYGLWLTTSYMTVQALNESILGEKLWFRVSRVQTAPGSFGGFTPKHNSKSLGATYELEDVKKELLKIGSRRYQDLWD